MIRLVATDLDGTLLRSDASVSGRTIAELARMEASGIDVVFVTARPMRWVDDLADLVHGHGIVICANGAVVYDVRRREVLSSHPLVRTTALDVVAAIRALVPGAAFARESPAGFAKEPGYIERDALPADALVGPIESLLDDETVKLLVRHEAMEPGALLARVLAATGPRVTATSSSSSGLVEISGPGVTKAGTLRAFCATRGIPATDVIAFGDMLNDLPMLEWAGTAIAVANAHPDVLAIADIVAPSNDDDGVAVVLEDLRD